MAEITVAVGGVLAKVLEAKAKRAQSREVRIFFMRSGWVFGGRLGKAKRQGILGMRMGNRYFQ